MCERRVDHLLVRREQACQPGHLADGRHPVAVLDVHVVAEEVVYVEAEVVVRQQLGREGVLPLVANQYLSTSPQ